jgi:Cu2+-exporting ATPase
MMDDFRRRFWVCLVLTVPIVFLSPMVVEMLQLPYRVDFLGGKWLVLLLSSIVFFFGGWPFLAGLAAEVRAKRPGMMTLIGVATSVAYGFSVAVTFGVSGMDLFWELATLIDIMLLGHWIEMKSVLGASRALEKLVQLLPSTAHVLQDDGSTRELQIAQLTRGMKFLVKPGERIPTDGQVVAGESSVNEAMLTGESAPVSKRRGDSVIGGSINTDGSLTVEVAKVGADSYLSQVIELVRTAQASRSRAQDLADRAAFFLTLIALGGGALTLAVWLLLGQTLAFAIERMVTVMVIACPHALGLAVPLVIAVSTALAARNGLLIRDRTAFERARLVNAVIFDKTGTLTEGEFGITDVIPFHSMTAADLQTLAAAVESQSEHPLAQAIVRDTQAKGLSIPPPEGFISLPGRGAKAIVGGNTVEVISPGELAERGLQVEDAQTAAVAAQGKTVVFVVVDGQLVGAIALADKIRPAARAALEELRANSIKVMLLTGDAAPVAAWVSRELGLDQYFAQVLPHEKAAKVEEVRRQGLTVAMVGDGINDAPALAAADLGVAIGAGADVAIETADVVLVRSNPQDIVRIIELSRATYAKMVQNLWWAAGYNIIAVPLAAGVLLKQGIVLTPAFGAVLMSLSTIVVAINAQRLRYSPVAPQTLRGDGTRLHHRIAKGTG